MFWKDLHRRKIRTYNLHDISTKTDTNKPVIDWTMSIGVKGHAPVTGTGGRGTEVRRGSITAPMTTVLVTISRVTRNEEAAVERGITDQQLVGVSDIHSHTVPQSISSSSLPIVQSGRYGLVGLSLEIDFCCSLMIKEYNFCELKQQQ